MYFPDPEKVLAAAQRALEAFLAMMSVIDNG